LIYITKAILPPLANNQLEQQFLYFLISSLHSSTCFEQRRSHHQGVKLY